MASSEAIFVIFKLTLSLVYIILILSKTNKKEKS
jgi:hypothetical protein